MKEIWKDIIGYEGIYQISNMGVVKSLEKKVTSGLGFCVREEKCLKPFITRKGYLHVRLYKDKNSKDFKVHRLVAVNFIPNPGNKPEVNHLNGDKKDNTILNLEWCTGSENIIHAFSIGTRVKQFGMLNNNPPKLNDKKVTEIKLMYNKGGTSMRKLAKKYGVDYALINRIVNGKSWPHVILKPV